MHDFMNKMKDDSSDEEDTDDAKTDNTSESIESVETGISPSNANIAERTTDICESDDDSVVEVPDNFIFPGYMAFRLWGPFAAPEDRLLIFEVDDAPKNAAALSRAAKRKLDMNNKDMDRAYDETPHRGFSTDQQISIEGLILQRKMQRQQEMDSTMVAFIA